MTHSFKTAGLAALAGIGLFANPALADEHGEDATQMSRGEQRLAKMLDGRVAGEPESCINTLATGSLQIVDRTALVYRQGRTLWVNYTRNPESLDDDDYLVIKKFGDAGRLCRLDNVTSHDRGSNFFSGIVMLDDFVPYRLADKSES